MSYTVTDMAEAQAIGICWLARAPGLPDIPQLRLAAVNLHPDECGYCAYPLDRLLRMLDSSYGPEGFGRPSGITERAEKDWWALPNRARAVAIAAAQGSEDAA